MLHLKAQAVSRWYLPAEAWVRSQFSLCGIRGEQSGTRTRFAPSSLFVPVSIIQQCSVLIFIYIMLLSDG
jgi:hypothetical protein